MSAHSSRIAVLGGGILGLAASFALAQEGYAVTLYDPQGFPADNASARAGGMLAPYSEIEHMGQDWVEAGLAGIALWRAWQDLLGRDCGFRQKGSLFVAHPEDRYILERFRAHLPPGAGRDVRTGEIEPALAGRFSGGLYLDSEAHIHPRLAMQTLADSLKDMIEYRAEAAEPDALPAGFERVIDCRGMGAAKDQPDLRGVKGELAVVHNPDFTLARPLRLMHPRYPLYIVPRPDHVFMIGATVIESEGEEQVSLRSSLELMSALYSLHPNFGAARILELSAGIRPSYPDNLPRVTAEGRVISCNGSFRHGWLFAPVMAQVAAAIVKGEDHAYISLFKGETQRGRDHTTHRERAA